MRDWWQKRIRTVMLEDAEQPALSASIGISIYRGAEKY